MVGPDEGATEGCVVGEMIVGCTVGEMLEGCAVGEIVVGGTVGLLVGSGVTGARPEGSEVVLDGDVVTVGEMVGCSVLGAVGRSESSVGVGCKVGLGRCPFPFPLKYLIFLS